MARAVFSSPLWPHNLRPVVVRVGPRPVLCLLDRVSRFAAAQLSAQARNINRTCARLRYIGYRQAELDCQRLAEQLIDRFGREELGRFRFAAVPRGGLIVLGMLSYTLGLKPTQLKEPRSPNTPLVIVDDCALTGARFGRFLRRYPNQKVIFIHLYSHPDLRAQIEAREPQVMACLSAQDLHDHGPDVLGSEYPAWRERWLARLKGPRYWIGQPDHICFPWNEPDRPIWNPIIEEVQSSWPVLPPEYCLKGRPVSESRTVSLQMQPEATGPLKPSDDVIYGELDDQIVLGNLATSESFELAGVAADMWRAIVKYGNLEGAATVLLEQYDIEETTLRADLQAFVDDLTSRGLLEQTDALAIP